MDQSVLYNKLEELYKRVEQLEKRQEDIDRKHEKMIKDGFKRMIGKTDPIVYDVKHWTKYLNVAADLDEMRNALNRLGQRKSLVAAFYGDESESKIRQIVSYFNSKGIYVLHVMEKDQKIDVIFKEIGKSLRCGELALSNC